MGWGWLGCLELLGLFLSGQMRLSGGGNGTAVVKHDENASSHHNLQNLPTFIIGQNKSFAGYVHCHIARH